MELAISSLKGQRNFDGDDRVYQDQKQRAAPYIKQEGQRAHTLAHDKQLDYRERYSGIFSKPPCGACS
jgi:hypothetical protein